METASKLLNPYSKKPCKDATTFFVRFQVVNSKTSLHLKNGCDLILKERRHFYPKKVWWNAKFIHCETFFCKQLSNTLGKFSNFFIKTFFLPTFQKMYYEQFITQEGQQTRSKGHRKWIGGGKSPKKIITSLSTCIKRILYKICWFLVQYDFIRSGKPQ